MPTAGSTGGFFALRGDRPAIGKRRMIINSSQEPTGTPRTGTEIIAADVEHLDRIAAVAIAQYPHEACGVLIGR